MSLDTFNDLKLEIISFSHRGDIDQKLETFIAMAEQDMYGNPDEILRVRGQETKTTLTTSGQFLALPADYQSMRSIRLVTGNGNFVIQQQAPAQIHDHPASGQPHFFTVTDQIEFERLPDQDYDVIIQYYAIPAALEDSNQTNSTLDNFPNIYLFGALAAVFTWANEEILAAQYYQSFIRAIKGANKKDKQGRYGPSPAMTPAGPTP